MGQKKAPKSGKQAKGKRAIREFEIRPIGEFIEARKREAPRVVRLKRENVPPALQDLIPLAERYGEGGGDGRELAYQGASRAERSAFKKALVGRHDAIEDFIYDAGEEQSDEHHRFSNLLVFELEYLKGPGIRGKLDHARERFRREVWQALDGLNRRIDSGRALARDFSWLKQDLKAAEKLSADVTRAVGAKPSVR